jgi:shikimate kinase
MIVYLIGFMGSGKSYWGRRLAAHLGGSWRDLDLDVEMGERSTISTLFELHGEAGFRAIEQRYLHQTIEYPTTSNYLIISTGGGAPCFFDNMAWMKAHGTTIWLNPTPSTLAQRLWPEREKRPLLRDVPESAFQRLIEDKLRARTTYYAQADWEFCPEAYEDSEFLMKLADASNA